MRLRKRVERLEQKARPRMPDLNRGLDDLVAATESPQWFMSRPGPKSFEALAEADRRLREAGVLDPDEPTEYTHRLYHRQMTRDFTPGERRQIRSMLGIDPL